MFLILFRYFQNLYNAVTFIIKNILKNVSKEILLSSSLGDEDAQKHYITQLSPWWPLPIIWVVL